LNTTNHGDLSFRLFSRGRLIVSLSPPVSPIVSQSFRHHVQATIPPLFTPSGSADEAVPLLPRQQGGTEHTTSWRGSNEGTGHELVRDRNNPSAHADLTQLPVPQHSDPAPTMTLLPGDNRTAPASLISSSSEELHSAVTHGSSENDTGNSMEISFQGDSFEDRGDDGMHLSSSSSPPQQQASSFFSLDCTSSPPTTDGITFVPATFPLDMLRKERIVDVFCHDCETKSKTSFHFLGLECRSCGSFNTAQA
jgi:hypothetical protein